jgi:hypothetical protein
MPLYWIPIRKATSILSLYISLLVTSRRVFTSHQPGNSSSGHIQIPLLILNVINSFLTRQNDGQSRRNTPAAAKKETTWRIASAGKSNMLARMTQELTISKMANIQARINSGTGMNTISLLFR